MIDQSGPTDRDSGRESRSPPTASRASIAGQRGSKRFEIFAIVLQQCDADWKRHFSAALQNDCRRIITARRLSHDGLLRRWVGRLKLAKTLLQRVNRVC